MNFNGEWKNKTSGEIIKLHGPLGSDDYLLEYRNESDIDFKVETVFIFFSDHEHALFSNSERFGRTRLRIISANSIEIGNSIFDRH